jgi:CDGSH-type Zn-finger protein
MGIKITVLNHGPIRIESGEEGELKLADAEGTAFGLGGRTAISLCRCGHSANKPFCDGSHRRERFESQCPARDLPPAKPQS